MVAGAVLNEIPQCPERAFIASDRRNVTQRVVKADLRKRAEIRRAEFAFEELALNPPARAPLEIEVPIQLFAHPLNPLLVTRSSYDLRFWYREIDALRPEQIHKLTAGLDLSGNGNMIRCFALVIEKNELRDLFDGFRLVVSLLEDVLAGLGIGFVYVKVSAVDLFRW